MLGCGTSPSLRAAAPCACGRSCAKSLARRRRGLGLLSKTYSRCAAPYPSASGRCRTPWSGGGTGRNCGSTTLLLGVLLSGFTVVGFPRVLLWMRISMLGVFLFFPRPRSVPSALNAKAFLPLPTRLLVIVPTGMAIGGGSPALWAPQCALRATEILARVLGLWTMPNSRPHGVAGG